MAGRNRPSFLKKQKEEQRRARATRKREERRLRKLSPVDAVNPDPTEDAEQTIDGDETGEPGDQDRTVDP